MGSKTIYYDYLYLQHYSLAESPSILVVTLFVSLLWPTFFMGVSLPLLARGLTHEIEAAAGTVGALYGINTLGAATGSLVTTWILLRQFGFETILRIGAVLNLSAALCGLLLAVYLFHLRGSFQGHAVDAIRDNGALSTVAQEESGFRASFWILIYALSGFIALSLEVLWFRLLGIMLKSTAFTFGSLLAIYLGGLAVGTLLGIALVGRSRMPTRAFLILQAGIGLYAALALSLLIGTVSQLSFLAPFWQYFGESSPMDVGAAAGAIQQYLSGSGPLTVDANRLAMRFLDLYVILPVFLIGPPTLMMGLSFPYLQKVVQKNAAYLGRRVGWLQTANIAGSMLGTFLTGWVWLPWLGTPGTLRLLAVLAGVFLVLWAQFQSSRSRRWKLVASLGVVALVVSVCSFVPDPATLWAKLHGMPADRITFAEDGTGLSVLKSSRTDFVGPTDVYLNGRSQSWIPYGSIHSMLGALPALIHPNPKEIAIIGLGSGDTVFHVGGRPETAEITCIEIVGPQLSTLDLLASRQDYPALLSILEDKRIRYVISDGRVYIMQHGRKYDIIEADALHPESAYAGNLYSEEYFKLIRDHLNPGGLAVTWSPTGRVYDTFVKVFPYVLSFDVVLIGSNEPINLDLNVIDARLEDPFTREYYQWSFVDMKETIRSFLDTYKPKLLGPADVRPAVVDTNSDLFPMDEYLIPRRHP